MSVIQSPVLYIPDPTKGRPLFYGQVYVGEPDLDPLDIPLNQKQLNVVQEDGSLVAVAQPFILSAGGTPVYQGSNVQLDTTGNYSMVILDKNGDQVYYVANAYEGTGSGSQTFDIVETPATLADGQLDVDFITANTSKAAIFVNNGSGDRGRLIEGVDYEVTGTTSIALFSSYEAGTMLIAQTSFAVSSETGYVKAYTSIDDAKNDSLLKDGDILNIKERTSSGSDGAVWDVVETSTVSPNGLNVIQNEANTSVSLQLRINDVIEAKLFGLTGVGDEAEGMEIMLSMGKNIIMESGVEYTFERTVTCPNGANIDMNGAIFYADHDGRMFTDEVDVDFVIDNLTIVNGEMNSRNGINGEYIQDNESFRATNAYINNVSFNNWGNDAWRAMGDCNCPLMMFDEIRDNPVVTSNDNNRFGRVIGGSCGGDGILFKGNNNSISEFYAVNVGWRENDIDFSAGSMVVIGADEEDANNCYVGYAECDTVGALVVGTEGDNNYIDVAKVRKSYYVDTYPVGGGTRKAEAANLNGSDNTIGALIVTESISRGLGIGGSVANRNKVRNLDINELTVGEFINIDLPTNLSCEVTRGVCQKSPNSAFIRIIGAGFRSELLSLISGTGGGLVSGTLAGDDIVIDKLLHRGDGLTSSGNGYELSGTGSINYIDVTGMEGSLVTNDGFTVGRYTLENTANGSDRILKIDSGKHTVMNSKVVDLNTDPGDRGAIANNVGTEVVFKNNVAANMTTDGNATVINADNI